MKLSIGFPHGLSTRLSHEPLITSLSHLHSFTCETSTRQTFLPLAAELMHLKTLRLLSHADDHWMPPSRRPVFSIEVLHFVADAENPPAPDFFEWLLSCSRLSLRALRLETSYGVDALRTLECTSTSLQHLWLERFPVWPIDSDLQHDDADFEDADGGSANLTALVHRMPPSLQTLSLAPSELSPVEVDALAEDLLELLPRTPSLTRIRLGGSLTAMTRGALEDTLFYQSCKDMGVLVSALP
jgi:hypothetical protein